MHISVYDSTQANYRGAVTVVSVDYKNETVTLSGTLKRRHRRWRQALYRRADGDAALVHSRFPTTPTPPTAGTWLTWTRANYPEIITP